MPRRPLEVDGLPWPAFRARFAELWEPGQHVAIIAPTGTGKTTFAGNILDLRRYVLALDPKGGDPTLIDLGYPRLTGWPGDRSMERLIAENDEKGQVSRYVVGPLVQTEGELFKLRGALAETLAGVFSLGGFTEYIDELQLLTDRKYMGLNGPVERHLIAGRAKGISVVSTYQAPRWVPRSASEQATWLCVSHTRDRDVVDRLAEMLGRDKAEVRGAVTAMGTEEYSWLIGGRNPRHPLMVTKPPRVRAVAQSA